VLDAIDAELPRRLLFEIERVEQCLAPVHDHAVDAHGPRASLRVSA
jgi:hypothetical protein